MNKILFSYGFIINWLISVFTICYLDTSFAAVETINKPNAIDETLPLKESTSQDRNLINIRSKVAHRDEKPLTLADFLCGDDLSRPLLKIFSQYSFGNAPKAGEMRQFSSQLISGLLRQARVEHSQLLKRYHFSIPAEVEVFNPGDSLADFELREALLEQWTNQCPSCRFEIQQLVLPRIPNRVKVGQGWHFSGVPELPRGSFRAALQFDDPKSAKGSRGFYWVNGVARVLKPSPVAVRQLSFNDRVTAADFSIEYRDVTFSHDAPLSVDQIVGRKLRVTKGIGQILWDSDLQKEKAILRGEWVRVIAQEGSMEVTVMAQAETDGFVGDTIRLQLGNQKSNSSLARQSISGVVRAPGEVVLP